MYSTGAESQVAHLHTCILAKGHVQNPYDHEIVYHLDCQVDPVENGYRTLF